MARSEILTHMNNNNNSTTTKNTRKRQRDNFLLSPQNNTTNMNDTNNNLIINHTNNNNEQDDDDILYQDKIINEMLNKQTNYLNNNLTIDKIDNNNNNNNTNNTNNDYNALKQPIQRFYNYDNNHNDTKQISIGTTNVKKQRTISLPQLPLSKLDLFNLNLNNNDSNYIDNIPIRTQNDNELLNLTGSSTKTLQSNKSVPLRIIQQQHEHEEEEPHSHHLHTNFLLNRKFKKRSKSSSINNTNTMDYFKTDENGHYIYQDNDTFGEQNKFIAKELLGQGTFGKVLKCFDQIDQRFVAVKIIRSVDRYREAAKTELRVLNTIAQNDITGTFQCLLLLDYFDYKNHICLITNLHGKSIYDFMCSNGIGRFPGSHIQAIARQLIRSICFLHDLNIIHTDIKPENILLCDDQNFIQYQLPEKIVKKLSPRRRNASNNGIRKILQNPEIKIIDFGSAIFYDEYHPPIISTRHYRAPEIVLGLSWSYPCDIWSIACVLVELATGESLYPIHNNFEHMVMMQKINQLEIPEKLIDTMFYKYDNNIGNLPQDLNSTVIKHFNKNTKKLIWPEIDNFTGKTITDKNVIKRIENNVTSLDQLIGKFIRNDLNDPNFIINSKISPEQNWLQLQSLTKQSKETFLFWYYFLDLLNKMFEFDPTKRITAKQALDHEWFNLGILDEGITSFY
ncbi:dual specificity protein kinase kns1 [Maudiozyma exigua]|uniref:Dual specificity protein kinase kns1 n=1 Tax=Maudiozyma exigua TaxID=34358 RepID=A0A9P6WCK8_MAUEX|nr:dual specificity protein kinase kns1 [Kazachstania exigua]